MFYYSKKDGKLYNLNLVQTIFMDKDLKVLKIQQLFSNEWLIIDVFDTTEELESAFDFIKYKVKTIWTVEPIER